MIIKKLVVKFIYHQGVLYKRISYGMQLYCLDENEVRKVMTDVHEGIYGPHMNGTALAIKIIRQGFFRMTMIGDCVNFTKRCHKFQIYEDISYLPQLAILVAIDYFTKWVSIVLQ